MKAKLTNVRLAFPTLFEAKTVNGEGEPQFSACFLMDKAGHTSLDPLKKVVEAVGAEKWGAKWPQIKKQLEAQDRICLHDGEIKGYDGFADQWYVNANNRTRPTIIDRDKTPLVAADGKPYAGCYVNASLDVWAMDNQYGKRICASLRGVQFFKDGDRFAGGGVADDDEFDDLGVEETVDDLT